MLLRVLQTEHPLWRMLRTTRDSEFRYFPVLDYLHMKRDFLGTKPSLNNIPSRFIYNLYK